MKKIILSLLSLLLLHATGFTQEKQLNKYEVAKDIVWASPGGFDLTMDIYSPQTEKKKLPVLVIFHGGGWLINNKSIMDEMSRYVAEHDDYVVCNVNYRLLADEGNTITLNQIIEDAFGAVLWIKTNIGEYGGDADNIAVTGDSAGGHLAEMVVVRGSNFSDSGFSQMPLGFKPSYIPPGKSLSKIKKKGLMDVQAAVISYGSFDIYANCKGNFEESSNIFWQRAGAKARSVFGDSINVRDNEEYYKAVSPIFNIPEISERKLPPQLFTVGSEDNLTTPALVKDYVDKVKAAGHPAEYWVYEGRPHAFLDSGSNEYLGISFEKDAPEALDRMISFLNSVFY